MCGGAQLRCSLLPTQMQVHLPPSLACCPPDAPASSLLPSLPSLPRARRPDYAQQFIDTLPQAELVWVDECGHCAHLEQPHALLQAVARFTGLEEAAAEAAAELCKTAAYAHTDWRMCPRVGPKFHAPTQP